VNTIEPELQRYLDEEGRVTRWTGKRFVSDQVLILDYLASKFETGKVYTEREVNAILNQWHTFEDWALLRRELFERGYMNREKNGSAYWLTPKVTLF
jgi:hypothetical protein